MDATVAGTRKFRDVSTRFCHKVQDGARQRRFRQGPMLLRQSEMARSDGETQMLRAVFPVSLIPAVLEARKEILQFHESPFVRIPRQAMARVRLAQPAQGFLHVVNDHRTLLDVGLDLLCRGVPARGVAYPSLSNALAAKGALCNPLGRAGQWAEKDRALGIENTEFKHVILFLGACEWRGKFYRHPGHGALGMSDGFCTDPGMVHKTPPFGKKKTRAKRFVSSSSQHSQYLVAPCRL